MWLKSTRFRARAPGYTLCIRSRTSHLPSPRVTLSMKGYPAVSLHGSSNVIIGKLLENWMQY